MVSLKDLAGALGLALIVSAGCGSSDSGKSVAGTPDAGVAVPDAGGSPAAPDGGAADGGAPMVTLVEWVSDLVVTSTSATAAPDTVEDKHVTPTEDPSAFDTLIAQ